MERTFKSIVRACLVAAIEIMHFVRGRFRGWSWYEGAIDRRIAVNHRAVAWVVAELAKHGIPVTVSDENVLPATLHIPATPEQYGVVRDVFARAYWKFLPCVSQWLCGGIVPVNPLDRAWARRHGVDAYAIPQPQGFCDCGVEVFGRTLWTSQKEYQALLDDEPRRRAEFARFCGVETTQPKRLTPVCRECQKRWEEDYERRRQAHHAQAMNDDEDR